MQHSYHVNIFPETPQFEGLMFILGNYFNIQVLGFETF